MGCDNCSSGSNGQPKGCRNNGNCGVLGCNKLEVFDWLSGVEIANGKLPFDIVEVRFKNDRKEFYRKSKDQEIYTGDVIVTQAKSGHDIGIVASTGEIVRMLMKNKQVKDNHEIPKVLRKASEEDIEKWQEARKKEWDTMIKARTFAIELGLTMKISDVEYQGDGSKATFYYTADGRVDFRELIKRFAGTFKIRVEMRQIGTRQEAGKLGAIGSCGRELCCSTWLTDFRTVSTSAARYQQLSLNPSKLAGQCGKLKCCLNYELDQYIEAIKEFPSTKVKLITGMGKAFHFKTDVFKRVMYYIYEDHRSIAPVGLSLDSLHEIIEMNKNGEKPESLTDFVDDSIVEEELDYLNVVGQDSLTRFDQKKKKKRKSRKRPPARKPSGTSNRKNNGQKPNNKQGKPKNSGGQNKSNNGPQNKSNKNNKGRRKPNPNNNKKN